MFSSRHEIDPVVEILRLAYRRGLALYREQSKEINKAVNANYDEKLTDQKELGTLSIMDANKPNTRGGGVR